MSAKDLLRMGPRGSYTTARTVDSTKVFGFDTHVERLGEANVVWCVPKKAGAASHELQLLGVLSALHIAAKSSKLMINKDNSAMVSPDVLRTITDAALLRPYIARDIRRGLLAYQALHRSEQRPQQGITAETEGSHNIGADLNRGEAKITLLLAWDGSGRRQLPPDVPSLQGAPLKLYTHIGPLPSARARDVVAHVRGAPRSNAEAKDSEWVRQRAGLEEAKPSTVEEVLLASGGASASAGASGSGEKEGQKGESSGVRVLEGTQTNFLVLQGGVLWTAKEGVLEGTVLRVAVQEAEAMGLSVRREAPLAGDLDKWDAACISSTSRLLMPIDAIAMPSQWAGSAVAAGLESGGGRHLSASLSASIQAKPTDVTKVWDHAGLGQGDAKGVVRELVSRVRGAVLADSIELVHGQGDGSQLGHGVGPDVEQAGLQMWLSGS